jgi:UDP-sugar transporter A1/2/3
MGTDILKKWRFIIPPFIQVLCLNVQYIGLTMAAASVTQMMYASAVLWSALFSLLLLKRRFTSTQCLAIGAITIGTTIVGISTALLSGHVYFFFHS